MSSPICVVLKSLVKPNLLRNNRFQLPIINSVRFRKPRWLPIAKSKEFYVRKPTPIIPEEAEELYMRYSKYRADVASIRLFLQEQIDQKDVDLTKQQEEDDADDLKLMTKQVKEWNSQVAASRQKRQDQDAKAEKERIQLNMQKLQEDRLHKALQAEKKLERDKAATFINPEDLDEAIEVMLDSRSDYNYAVTNSGDILAGEYPENPSSLPPSRTKMSDIP